MAVLIGFIETHHTSTTNLIMTVSVLIPAIFLLWWSLQEFDVYYQIFQKKTMMPFSTNSNFMYIFEQQQYYRFRLCRFVLHPCIGLMYNFIVLDSVTKSWASVYNHDEKLIMLSHWICNRLQIIIYPCVLLQFQVQ